MRRLSFDSLNKTLDAPFEAEVQIMSKQNPIHKWSLMLSTHTAMWF